MLLRLPLAFVVGWVFYMVAMMMTVYDGLPSLILQLFVGAIFTAIALMAITAIGSPLLLPRVWPYWRKLGWYSLAVPVAGMTMLALSWYPSLRVTYTHPELNTPVESFHPVLSIAGFLLTLLGVAYCPVLGLWRDRRWA